MYVTAIVLAAGKGLRFKSRIPKPLVKINSQPLIIYCLNTLSKHPYVKDIVVVVNPDNFSGILSRIRKYKIGRIKKVVLGGRLRQDSVFNGLKAVDIKSGLVLIHDAARPFIAKNTISRLIKEAGRRGVAIAGVPVKATIKRVTGYGLRVTGKFLVKETIDRNNLWEIQTPQVFKKDLLLRAYKKFGDSEVSDDAALVEKLGVKASIVPGSYNNIKLTTPEDLIIAEAIASRCSVSGSRCSDKNR